MNRSKGLRTLFLLTVAASVGFLGSLGCSSGNAKRLNASGSSFVLPAMTKWASEYNKATGVEVNYQSTGSSSGIEQMTVQTTDFGCSDAPMTEAKIEEAKQKNGDVIHIPLCMGGVVPIYNLPGVKDPLRFTGLL
ncbi:MAG: substrate-binding domain-containing protein, partial [Gemmataceae bacterium]